MINIAAPGKAKIIGYKINSIGLLTLSVLSSNTDNLKEKLVDKGSRSSAVISKEVLGKNYQQNVFSLVVGKEKSPSIININYVSGGKNPSKFAAESSTLLLL